MPWRWSLEVCSRLGPVDKTGRSFEEWETQHWKHYLREGPHHWQPQSSSREEGSGDQRPWDGDADCHEKESWCWQRANTPRVKAIWETTMSIWNTRQELLRSWNSEEDWVAVIVCWLSEAGCWASTSRRGVKDCVGSSSRLVSWKHHSQDWSSIATIGYRGDSKRIQTSQGEAQSAAHWPTRHEDLKREVWTGVQAPEWEATWVWTHQQEVEERLGEGKERPRSMNGGLDPNGG